VRQALGQLAVWHALQVPCLSASNARRNPSVLARVTRRSSLAWLCAWLCLALPARAEPPRDEVQIEDILPLANDPNDPIGLDREPDAPDAGRARSEPKAQPTRNAADLQRFGPAPPVLEVRAGEVLTAIPNVRESTHRVTVELAAGLSMVTSELRFESNSERPAEVLYRLAVPPDAALGSLLVQNDAGERKGLPDDEPWLRGAYDDAVQARGPAAQAHQAPVAHVHKLRDPTATALLLTAAPVALGHPLSVRVSYLTATPQRGGSVRLRLPARGMDPRAAALQLTVRSGALELVEVGQRAAAEDAAPWTFDAWTAVEIVARAREQPGLSAQLWRFACGDAQCMRAYVRAGPAPLRPLDLVLAIDGSPSMEGPARTRVLGAIAAVLSQAPKGSRVRALMFASQAVPILPRPLVPSAVSLQSFAAVSGDAELGSATRFESAWQLLESWGFARSQALRRAVIVIGDGGLTTGPARAFEAARRAGVEVSVLNLADRTCSAALARGAALTHGVVVEAGEQAGEAEHSHDSSALEERVSVLFAPVAASELRISDGRHKLELPALRHGEELSYEAQVTRFSALRVDGRTLAVTTPAPELLASLGVRGAELRGARDPRAALAAVDARDLALAGQGRPDPQGSATRTPPSRCDRRGPAQRYSGQSSDLHPLALAVERAACALPAAKPAASPPAAVRSLGEGMPSSPLLSMLRQRIIPVARACFRMDRAGRPDYQVRAVFAFRLAEREVVSAEVTGKIAEELRRCLLAAVDSLAVPRFSGSIVVRYPLVTEKEALPSEIELTPTTAERLDSVLQSR
jgi:hypothetical protein